MTLRNHLPLQPCTQPQPIIIAITAVQLVVRGVQKRCIIFNVAFPSGLESENEKMSDSIRDTGFFAVVGILLAILIIGGIAAASLRIPTLRLPSMTSNRGALIIQIMDKPVELDHLNITIDWVKIQDQNETWIDLDIKGGAPFYFDLLALQNVTETLSETSIPAGNYTMIKMHVLTANATYPDGSTATLNVPSDVIRVLLKPHLKMEAEGTITILIDLQPDDIKTIAISHNLNLRPVVKATVKS